MATKRRGASSVDKMIAQCEAQNAGAALAGELIVLEAEPEAQPKVEKMDAGDAGTFVSVEQVVNVLTQKFTLDELALLLTQLKQHVDSAYRQVSIGDVMWLNWANDGMYPVIVREITRAGNVIADYVDDRGAKSGYRFKAKSAVAHLRVPRGCTQKEFEALVKAHVAAVKFQGVTLEECYNYPESWKVFHGYTTY